MIARAWITVTVMLSASYLFAGQNIVIVLDDSGSMGQPMRSDRQTKKIDAARSALRTVLEQLPEDAQVGLVALNGPGDGWLIPLGPRDPANLSQAVNRIQARGGTPLGSHMKVGADALLAARAKQRYGTYKLLIVTDGEAGDKELVERYLPDIVSRGLVVDVIGVDMRQDHSLATKVQTYRRADDPGSLEAAISAVVLGESAVDASDAGASDFELLAGLPDEVAVAALTALSEQGNEPIGRRAAAATQPGEVAQAFPSQPASPSSRTVTLPGPQPQPGGSAGGVLLGMCCVGSIFVVILLGVGIILVVRK